jgi:hypothetical protein
MQWTRQRRQVALRPVEIAAFGPPWGVGDDKLDAAQAAAGELAKEVGPEGLGLRGTDVHAAHLAAAVGVDCPPRLLPVLPLGT